MTTFFCFHFGDFIYRGKKKKNPHKHCKYLINIILKNIYSPIFIVPISTPQFLLLYIFIKKNKKKPPIKDGVSSTQRRKKKVFTTRCLLDVRF
jgi:hypothetical protein